MTYSLEGCCARSFQFNSIQFTHPRGVRLPPRPDVTRHPSVSIHAPAKGATAPRRSAAHTRRRFNSRTREGCDLHDLGIELDAKQFQFTHPRGVRQSALGAYEKVYQFQFTHPRGVRPTSQFVPTGALMFQFTHPRGVRLSSYFDTLSREMFQFTRPRGVRPHTPALPAARRPFQFTHPRGVRLQEWGGGCGAASTDLL